MDSREHRVQGFHQPGELPGFARMRQRLGEAGIVQAPGLPNDRVDRTQDLTRQREVRRDDRDENREGGGGQQPADALQHELDVVERVCHLHRVRLPAMRRAQRGDAKQLRVGGGDRLERDLAAAHHLLELRRIELQRHVRAEERHDATARIDDLNDGPKGPQQPPDTLGRQRLDGARRSLFVNLGADTLRGMQEKSGYCENCAKDGIVLLLSKRYTD